MLSHVRPGSICSFIQSWAGVIGAASTRAMIDLPPAPSISTSPEQRGNHHHSHYKNKRTDEFKPKETLSKLENLKCICNWNVQALFLVRPLLSMVSPTARPPLCSEWTHSVQDFTPRSACPQAIMLQLEEIETQARAHSILKEILLVKTWGKPSNLRIIFPNPLY